MIFTELLIVLVGPVNTIECVGDYQNEKQYESVLDKNEVKREAIA